MLTTIIMNNIFQDTEEGKFAAAAYALTAQEEFGLEWLANHNYTIACALAHLRVLTDARTASAFLIELIQEYVDSDFEYADMDLDFASNEDICIKVVWALSFILQSDLYSEDFFYDRIMNQARSIIPTDDAVHLKPI